MSKNDVQFESVLSSIIIMPVYLNSENILFLNPGGSENDLPFSPLLLTPADQMSRGELSVFLCGGNVDKYMRQGSFQED